MNTGVGGGGGGIIVFGEGSTWSEWSVWTRGEVIVSPQLSVVIVSPQKC